MRGGPRASAWFAHKDERGAVTHIETRGPEFKGSLRGGTETLFRFPGRPPPLARLLIAEAPIDALSLAAIEGIRADTLYAATGCGMGPGTIAAIEENLETLAANRRTRLRRPLYERNRRQLCRRPLRYTPRSTLYPGRRPLRAIETTDRRRRLERRAENHNNNPER